MLRVGLSYDRLVELVAKGNYTVGLPTISNDQNDQNDQNEKMTSRQNIHVRIDVYVGKIVSVSTKIAGDKILRF